MPRIIAHLAIISCFVYSASTAAQGARNADIFEEVVVTAQKREQSLQDVGISITAFSGDQIEALGMTNTVEITQQVPGLDMVAWSPTLTAFNIRGVSQNNFTDNLEAPVAVYIDKAYVASMNGINAQLFDMERVEVLRGPQGTLFGRNATGGVIQYLTRHADEQELNGYIDVGGGDFGLRTFEGAVGGALSDTVRYRLATRMEQSDGYIESTPFPEGNPLPPSGGNLGGTDGYAIRAALQFDVGAAGQLDLLYRYSNDDKVPTGGYSFLPYADTNNPNVYIPPEFEDFVTDVIGAPAEATPDIFFCPSQLDCFAPVDAAGRTVFEGDHPQPHQNYSDYEGFMDRDMNSIIADFQYELKNGVEFTSITNWANVDKFYTEDGDGIPVPIIEFTTVADFTQVTQELRFSGSTETSRWQAGAYYLDIDYDGIVVTRGSPVAGVAVDLGFDPAMLTDPSVSQDNRLDSRNWSVFGQAEWDLGDTVTLITGLRYSQDDKDMSIVTSFMSPADGILIPATFDLAAEAASAGSDANVIDYDDFAARLQIDYRVSDNTLLFASYNRGIKGGNFAGAENLELDRAKHGEETLNAYEAGFKTDFADGRVRLNSTVFYYDYEDYQAFTFFNGTPNVTNAQARNAGAEVELLLRPTDRWNIVLGASFQDSEVDDVQTTQHQTTPVGFVVDWPVDRLNGVELPNTPDVSLNYLFQYNLPLGDSNLALQLDGSYSGDQYLEVTNGGAARQDAYNVLNARVTWLSADERWQLTGWVRNLADEVYKQYALDLGILGGTVYYAPPRWVGANLSYSW